MRYLISLFSLLLLAYSTLAQTAPVGGGRVEHLADFQSKYVQPRSVDVWLPAGYPKPGMKYPVLYMHDGQNLFSPVTAYGGVAWEVDSVLTALNQQGLVRECIVVGIWNASLRMREYTPAKPVGLLTATQRQAVEQEQGGPPLSDDYLKFVVTELKPYIDGHYRTAARRTSTFIAGSSMGGLISLYAALEYPKVFGGAACLSTHWPLSLQKNNAAFTDALVAYLPAKLHHQPRPLLYFDYGTATLDAWYANHQLRIDQALMAAGYPAHKYMTRNYTGAAHNEAAWKRRVAVPLQFLLSARP
ncbi:esterase [Hymenobacter taeanensis]|uniref:Esterase n=1 Tax=Hymenobacter taeanensis TaxID=2735321 RepID=A0A6M6BG49_9BACT|nr:MULTISPECIES: alpha/beta hydrolase [Hymenobacter]QJX46213.1 esterase [Hymenobacter taeanensis]UOQ80068.1 alpha/beta hydrolase [Hymenobacter sp. 5414T-23]